MARWAPRVAVVLPLTRESEARTLLADAGRPVCRSLRLLPRLVLLEGRVDGGREAMASAPLREGEGPRDAWPGCTGRRAPENDSDRSGCSERNRAEVNDSTLGGWWCVGGTCACEKSARNLELLPVDDEALGSLSWGGWYRQHRSGACRDRRWSRSTSIEWSSLIWGLFGAWRTAIAHGSSRAFSVALSSSVECWREP